MSKQVVVVGIVCALVCSLALFFTLKDSLAEAKCMDAGYTTGMYGIDGQVYCLMDKSVDVFVEAEVER